MKRDKQNRIMLMAFVFALLSVFSSTSFAVSIEEYEGELFDGVTKSDSITKNSFDTGLGWWFFYANEDDEITLTVNRIDAELDPRMNLYRGPQEDTYDLSEIIAIADDEISFVGGPFGDPQILDLAIDVAGQYSVIVWNISSDYSDGSLFEYQITLSGANPYKGVDPIPEPATILLMGIGLLCLAGVGRKKRRKNA